MKIISYNNKKKKNFANLEFIKGKEEAQSWPFVPNLLSASSNISNNQFN